MTSAIMVLLASGSSLSSDYNLAAGTSFQFQGPTYITNALEIICGCTNLYAYYTSGLAPYNTAGYNPPSSYYNVFSTGGNNIGLGGFMKPTGTSSLTYVNSLSTAAVYWAYQYMPPLVQIMHIVQTLVLLLYQILI